MWSGVRQRPQLASAWCGGHGWGAQNIIDVSDVFEIVREPSHYFAANLDCSLLRSLSAYVALWIDMHIWPHPDDFWSDWECDPPMVRYEIYRQTHLIEIVLICKCLRILPAVLDHSILCWTTELLVGGLHFVFLLCRQWALASWILAALGVVYPCAEMSWYVWAVSPSFFGPKEGGRRNVWVDE